MSRGIETCVHLTVPKQRQNTHQHTHALHITHTPAESDNQDRHLQPEFLAAVGPAAPKPTVDKAALTAAAKKEQQQQEHERREAQWHDYVHTQVRCCVDITTKLR